MAEDHYHLPDGTKVYYDNAVAEKNYPQTSATPSALDGWLNFKDATYLKGVVLGASVALVATNPTVQKAVVSGAVKLWSGIQGGVEEVKEQIRDIKAEASQD